MRLLLIKTSSLGDVIHTLPALTDALQHQPDLECHWVVEENFAAIPSWHPGVKKVIPVAWRRWRSSLKSGNVYSEIGSFISQLRQQRYDVILDAQGLLKSACISRLAHGHRMGLDFSSAREKIAALFYQRRLAVAKEQHAIDRLRHLFAQSLNYFLPQSTADYAINRHQFHFSFENEINFVFLHGTAWLSKEWPDLYWQRLIALAVQEGSVGLPWGNERERLRAERLATVDPKRCHVLPKMDLNQLAALLAQARGVVSVDTGPGHLTAALGTPAVNLYGPTDPGLTGTRGQYQIHLTGTCRKWPCKERLCPRINAPSAPCLSVLSPEWVWETLTALRSQKGIANQNIA
ncbi:MAG: lipopolysaccharide heptosyltransferase I [Magnetococcus sp. DMHC-6]